MSTRVEAAVNRAVPPVLEAIEAGRLPGAALGAITKDGARCIVHAGSAQLVPDRVLLTRELLFDLASLTKVVFTTPAILALVGEGRVGLDQPLAELIPDLRQYDPGAAERRLTVRQCLTHQTFLPAVEPLYTLGLDPQTLRAHILQRAWTAGPPVYSDINFLLLGIALERVNGMPLLDHPVPPGCTFRPTPEQCVATEYCTWRGRVVRGEVHDENAFAFGGASGHAGLFGTIDAVLDFAHSLLLAADDPSDPAALLLRRETAERTLGWLVPHPGWPFGEHCSERTIGHTGFTGTSVCVDFDRGVAWALLANRVHPTRHQPNILPTLRAEFTDRLLTEFQASPASNEMGP
jgi:CubicO group peptidase (beta-lactamase class C family)